MTFIGTPYFSIIIPTYNRAETIRQALESVQAQTFTDFECLVIDDGSDDWKALDDVVASLRDERFVLIRQNNQGACSARNRGLDACRGQYVAFLDSDDSFVPDKLEKCAAVIKDYHGFVFVYSQMIVDRGLGKVWLRPSRGVSRGERVDEYLLCTPGKIQTSTMVLPTAVAREVRFDESLPSLQDADFAIRVANTSIPIAFIEEPLIRFGDNSSEPRVSRDKEVAPLLDWLERMRGVAISDRSYWACRGWQCARVASYSNRPYALWLFVQSVARRVYPLRQTAVICAQVLIPYRFYQKIANLVVRIRGRAAPGHGGP